MQYAGGDADARVGPGGADGVAGSHAPPETPKRGKRKLPTCKRCAAHGKRDERLKGHKCPYVPPHTCDQCPKKQKVSFEDGGARSALSPPSSQQKDAEPAAPETSASAEPATQLKQKHEKFNNFVTARKRAEAGEQTQFQSGVLQKMREERDAARQEGRDSVLCNPVGLEKFYHECQVDEHRRTTQPWLDDWAKQFSELMVDDNAVEAIEQQMHGDMDLPSGVEGKEDDDGGDGDAAGDMYADVGAAGGEEEGDETMAD